jgi:hypothetical protein
MATEIWLSKGPDGNLIPQSDRDREYLARFKVGDAFKASVTMKRNGKHHRLGMMILQAVFDNQDRYTNFDAFLNEIKILTGHCDYHVSMSGQTYFVTKSIDFERMDELEFRRWKNEAITAVFQHIFPDIREPERTRLETYILALT